MTAGLRLHIPKEDYSGLDSPVPPELASLAQALDQSSELLELADDWDEQGSPGYQEATLERARHLVWTNTLRLWETLELSINVPRIAPGPYGSIDIHWKHGQRQLFVNVPADDKPATYYGDDRSQNVVKGSLDTSTQQEWLLLWLTK